MNENERAELSQLDADDRVGKVLTGAERGRLADLRRAEILDQVASMLPPVNPVTAAAEIR
jgi:hypothetical protein